VADDLRRARRDHVGRLRSALGALELRLSDESERALADFNRAEPAASAGSDVLGTLQITFVHDEPDLRIEVPAVPG
jgi:hypothetical protein